MPTPVHVRTQIRNAVAAAVTGLASTGLRVFKSRIRPQGEANLPCLLVVTDDEPEINGSDGSSPVLERSLDLIVKGFAKESAELDEVLDQIALEVEPAMNGIALSGAIKELVLRSIQVDQDDTTDKPVGVIALNYRITYYTAAGVPGTAL